MKSHSGENGPVRIEALRDILTRQRNALLVRIKDLRRSQVEERTTEPSDDMDIARSQAEVETHGSLMERSQNMLGAIDAAAIRLEQGQYGKCEECGLDIPLNRLEALPFAACCVDCQRESESGRGRAPASQSSMRRWQAPEEMSDSLEQRDGITEPEEQLTVHNGSVFGPEEKDLNEPEAERQYRRGA